MQCPVYKEIRNYREGVFMGLSMRQTAWGAAALIVAAVSNFVLRLFLDKELASALCVVLAALPAAVGFLQYHGLNFEQFAAAWLRTMFRHNGWYTYRAVCLFDVLHQAAEEERRQRGKKNKRNGKRKDEKKHVKKKK